MATVIKPKNARSKRALEKRAPKVIENPKTTLIVRGSQTSNIVQQALKDVFSLKKPNATNFSKKNEIHVFDDETKIEFLCNKNDASLFLIGSHSKKRPHNLVFGRLFDHKVFDMFEFEVSKLESINELRGKTCMSGLKPMLVFAGQQFNLDPNFAKLKNLFLDFFRMDNAESISLNGLQHVISFTIFDSPPDNAKQNQDQQPKIFVRSYFVSLLKSGYKQPRVELEDMGPNIDLTLKRFNLPTDEAVKLATRVPKELFKKKQKNVSQDNVGNKMGRVHVGKQQIDKIQTRKVKALKKSPLPPLPSSDFA